MTRLAVVNLIVLLLVLTAGCSSVATDRGIQQTTRQATETTIQQTAQQTTETKTWPDGISLGTWWWNAQQLRSVEEITLRLDFLQAENVNEVYLFYGSNVWDKYYRQFIYECHQRGIRVAALGGDANWLSDEGYERYQRWLARIARYQYDAAETEKFYGIHLDFEPDQNPDYAADPAAMSSQVARVYDFGRQFCDEHNLIFEADVSMWIDNPRLLMSDGDEQVTLGEYIARRVDTISIMAYRDTANEQFRNSLPMIRLAQHYDRKVLLGSETGQSAEAGFVTYFEEGKAIMRQEQIKLIGLMDQENIDYGLAVHYVESWLSLKD